MANYIATGYNGSNVMLAHTDNSNDMSLMAMLSNYSTVPREVRSAGGGLEDPLTSHRLFFSSTFEPMTEEREENNNNIGEEGSQHVGKKRRLSFDQVKSLEKCFELENWIESERKIQLAQELGLEPKQVSVWFQNHRARSKTKKLEKDFEVLTATYNRLKGDYDALLDEIDILKGNLQPPETSPVVDPSGEDKNSKKAVTSSEESEKLEPAIPKLNNASSGNGSQSVQAHIHEGSGEVSNREAFSSGSISSQISNVDSPHSGSLVVPPENNFHPQVLLEMDPQSFPLSDNLYDQMVFPACQSFSFQPEDGSIEDDASNSFLSQLEDATAVPWWELP